MDVQQSFFSLYLILCLMVVFCIFILSVELYTKDGRYERFYKRILLFLSRNKEPDTFNYCKKTTDENGCRYWFDAEQLGNVEKQWITKMYWNDSQNTMLMCFPVMMFLKSGLKATLDFRSVIKSFNDIYSSYELTLTWVIVEMTKPDDFVLMKKVAKEIWLHDQGITRENLEVQQLKDLEEERKVRESEQERQDRILKSREICREIELKRMNKDDETSI